MGLTKKSLKNPSVVFVLTAMIIVLGMLMTTKLPVQLFPSIERPQLGVQTFWRSASPSEIESEIIEPIEEVMLGLPGLEEMRTFSNPQFGWVNLEFSLEADMDRILIEVISRLNRLPPLPADADRPRVVMNGGNDTNQSLIYLFTQFREGSKLTEGEYVPFLEDEIVPRLMSVEGVSNVND